MSLLDAIPGDPLTPEGAFAQAADRQTPFGEYLGAKFAGGVEALRPYAIGERVLDTATEPRQEGALGQPLGPSGTLGQPPTQPLSKDAFEASPYNVGQPWHEGMTETLAQATHDRKLVDDYRASVVARYQGYGGLAGFVAGALPGLADPTNFIPILGEAAQAAMVARLGTILGHGLVAAGDAAANTALFEPLTARRALDLGQDFGVGDVATDILGNALAGSLFGFGKGWLHDRAATREALLRTGAKGLPRQADAVNLAGAQLEAGEAVDVGPVLRNAPEMRAPERPPAEAGRSEGGEPVAPPLDGATWRELSSGERAPAGARARMNLETGKSEVLVDRDGSPSARGGMLAEPPPTKPAGEGLSPRPDTRGLPDVIDERVNVPAPSAEEMAAVKGRYADAIGRLTKPVKLRDIAVQPGELRNYVLMPDGEAREVPGGHVTLVEDAMRRAGLDTSEDHAGTALMEAMAAEAGVVHFRLTGGRDGGMGGGVDIFADLTPRQGSIVKQLRKMTGDGGLSTSAWQRPAPDFSVARPYEPHPSVAEAADRVGKSTPELETYKKDAGLEGYDKPLPGHEPPEVKAKLAEKAAKAGERAAPPAKPAFGEHGFAFPITDEGGRHVGTIVGAKGLRSGAEGLMLQVHNAGIDDPAALGKGHAVRAYQQLADWALANGRTLASDVEVTADAARVYEALERRGYAVARNPKAKLQDVGGVEKWVGGRAPVFEVTKGPERGAKIEPPAPGPPPGEPDLPPELLDLEALRRAGELPEGADAALGQAEREARTMEAWGDAYAILSSCVLKAAE